MKKQTYFYHISLCTIGWLLAIVVYFFSIVLSKRIVTISPVYISVIMILFYFWFAHIFIEFLMTDLWRYIDVLRPTNVPARVPNKLTATLGVLDRSIYAICFTIQWYAFIGLWFSIKIASRLIQFKPADISKEKDDVRKIRELGERKNLFLIGNVVSLLLGIGAGWLIITLFNLPLPNFLEDLIPG